LESRDDQSKLFDEKVLELAKKAGLEQIEISEGEAGESLPCFLQFVQAEEKEDLAPVQPESTVEAKSDTVAECVDQVRELELDSKNEDKDMISKEVECSPQGDAAANLL